MGELVFVCPWLARGEKLGQVEGGGGRVPTFPFPFLGVGSLPLAFFAQVWTPRSSLTCLLMVAEPGLVLGPLSLIPWDRRDPWQGFCFPAPDTSPPLCSAPP